MLLRVAISVCAALIMAPVAAAAAGGRYYVNSTHPRADDAGPGTEQRPWKSLAALHERAFQPGDVVCFARGSVYTGGFVMKSSGAPGRPITLTACGTGPAPRFTNPDFSVLNGNVIQVKGSHVVIDGLYFHDGAQAPSGRNTSVLRVGDVFIDKDADHNTIRNCEVYNSPIGFNVCGRYTVITRNHLHDCNRPLKSPGWGPIAIMIGNADAEISHNRFRNYVSEGGTYGADGGAIEVDPRLYGTEIRNIRIHHNISYGNEGFLEVTKALDGIILAYNVSNDYQQFVLFWDGTDAIVEHNTVLRVLPKNSVTDVVFTFKNPGHTIRNNIFVVNANRQVFSDNGTQVYQKGNYAVQKRYHNLYFSVDGSRRDPCGLPLETGERIADPRFVSFEKQNYRLRPDSPAIDAAAGAGGAVDLDGTEVPAGKAPDIGAFEARRR